MHLSFNLPYLPAQASDISAILTQDHNLPPVDAPAGRNLPLSDDRACRLYLQRGQAEQRDGYVLVFFTVLEARSEPGSVEHYYREPWRALTCKIEQAGRIARCRLTMHDLGAVPFAYQLVHLLGQAYAVDMGELLTKLAPRAGRVPPAPAQAEPKRGAPKLTELDDAEAAEKKARLHQYLKLVLRPRNPLPQDAAAAQVAVARTTLERYRKTWPEVEAKVKAEMRAEQAQKVRKE